MAILSKTLKTNHKKLLSKQYISDYIIVEKAKQLKKWLVVLADNPHTELRIYINWIQSYLSNRTQCVAVRSYTSTDKHLHFWVPQGSVVGPRKYCLYSKPIGEICHRYNLLYHCYADDTQVYIVIRRSDSWDSLATKMEACLADISLWKNSNMLKLNQDKT